MSIQGITENDISNYLLNTPGFFERHAELLATVQLTSPHGHRAVSLQERQMEMLREKIKLLERERMAMIRHGRENEAIADRLHRFIRSILLARTPADVPDVMLASLQHEFLIPQAALRMWGACSWDGVMPASAMASPIASAVSDLRPQSMCLPSSPMCGITIKCVECYYKI